MDDRHDGRGRGGHQAGGCRHDRRRTLEGAVNRTTPIAKGDLVRVVAIEGLYLEIEPEEGVDRDYREMRSSRRDDTGADTDSD